MRPTLRLRSGQAEPLLCADAGRLWRQWGCGSGDLASAGARRFISEFARENNKPIDDITSEALNALMAYAWPGNVRELRNAIERMIVMAHGAKLTVHDLPGIIRPAAAGQGAPSLGIKPNASTRDANRQMIVTILDAAGGNRTKAARQLGISRRTLHRKLHEFGLPARRTGPKTRTDSAVT